MGQHFWIVSEQNEMIVDFIGRFENLQEDFNTICDKIEFHNNNFHIQTKLIINTIRNTTMMKLVKLLRKNTKKILSISIINLGNKQLDLHTI